MKDATRLLSDDSKGTPLPLDLAVNTDGGGETVRDVLHKKFPPRRPLVKLHSKWMNRNNIAEEYYECHTNDFFSKGTMDSAWTDRDVHCLIDIWADKEVQTPLESAKRNKPIFEKIVKGMSKAGYDKTAEQCREKIKKLKLKYNKIHWARKSRTRVRLHA